MSRAAPEVRCPFCGTLTRAAWLRVADGSVELGCASCGAAARYPAFEPVSSAAPAAADRFDDETSRDAPTAASPDEQFEGETARTRPGAPTPAALLEACAGIGTVPAELLERYRRVLAEGDRAEAHDELLRYAVAAGQIEALGLVYRFRLERFPADTLAEQMRNKVISAAIASIPQATTRHQAQSQIKRWTTIGAVSFFLFACLLAVSLLLRTGCLGAPG